MKLMVNDFEEKEALVVIYLEKCKADGDVVIYAKNSKGKTAQIATITEKGQMILTCDCTNLKKLGFQVSGVGEISHR